MTPTNKRVSLADIQPHKRNYNRHPASQIERIATSLRTFHGQVRSIVVWRNTILAGHGVVEAARSMGWTEIAADVLPDDYPEHLALAYVAADNELARLADPDLAALAAILGESKAHDAELLEAIGYSEAEFQTMLDELGGIEDEPYSREIKSPVYEPKNEKPAISDLFDDSKTKRLIADIDAADFPEDTKDFLRIAAQRHTVLQFNRIADFYAHSDAPIQRLMEDSALVIIDFNRAIELGYVKLSKEIAELVEDEYAE